MFVKFMHSNSISNESFDIIEVFKGQTVSFWEPPGSPSELQIIENGLPIAIHPIKGPTFVMSDDGKTVATYGNRRQQTNSGSGVQLHADSNTASDSNAGYLGRR